MAYSPMFGSMKREALWLRESFNAWAAGRGYGPVCNLCDKTVEKDEPWHESHDPGRAKAFGGKSVGVAHAQCNLDHGRLVVTPAIHKSNRVRAHFLGLKGPGLGRYPMRAGRRSAFTKTMRHGLQPRRSLAEKHAAVMAARAIVPLEVPAPPIAPEI